MCGAVEAGTSADDLVPSDLGISFIPNSTSTLRIERGGRNYEVDLVARTIRKIDLPPGTVSTSGAASSSLSGQPGGAAIFGRYCATCHSADAKGVAGLRTPDFTDRKIQANLKDEQIVTNDRERKTRHNDACLGGQTLPTTNSRHGWVSALTLGRCRAETLLPAAPAEDWLWSAKTPSCRFQCNVTLLHPPG